MEFFLCRGTVKGNWLPSAFSQCVFNCGNVVWADELLNELLGFILGLYMKQYSFFTTDIQVFPCKARALGVHQPSSNKEFCILTCNTMQKHFLEKLMIGVSKISLATVMYFFPLDHVLFNFSSWILWWSQRTVHIFSLPLTVLVFWSSSLPCKQNYRLDHRCARPDWEMGLHLKF